MISTGETVNRNNVGIYTPQKDTGVWDIKPLDKPMN